MSNILEELEKERKNIKTDSYSMSIGEIINLYKEGDLKLDPAFQRLFRWSDEQKTKFIESVLLGIPIPEIFVAQKGDGKWIVVDGVQRISTILQLVGNLKDKPPLKMTYAKYLPSLENCTWEALPSEVQRVFKRGKFGINIILTENSVEAQYELFQRLNTGGLHLEDQEIRNCLIIMIDPDFYEKINDLKSYPSFKNAIQLTDKRIEEEYHMELILRYLIAKTSLIDYSVYSSHTLISDFLDKETAKLIKNDGFNLDREIVVFKELFDFLYSTLGENAFKKFNNERSRFDGAFSNASFEAITSGLALNLEKNKALEREEFESKIKDLYSQEKVKENSKHGVKPLTRFKELTKFSKEYFN